MKTKALRLYGKNDLRLEEFELPKMKDDEILAKVISDSICMSTYKAAIQGGDHKRVPADCAQNPTIVGHEFCGEILEVGSKWAGKFKAGQKFSIQPALNYKGSLDAPGYSYKYIGGDATYIIIPNEVMEMDCLLPYSGDAFFCGSLAEPLSCVIGAFHADYHTVNGVYEHQMGIKPNGKMAILAGVGPMGLAAIDYIIHAERHPSLLVVTDIDDARLTRAASILSAEEAAKNGIELKYVNTGKIENSTEYLMSLTGGTGYDEVHVLAPVAPVVEQGDAILARDGCLNFFSGPSKTDFSAKFNFYNVHYASTHIVGTSGGNTEDMKESLDMMSNGLLNPACLVTHIGGLDSARDAVLNLPNIPGGKKLIYTGIKMPLIALNDLEKYGESNAMFAKLAEMVKKNNGLWSAEAEKFLLANAEKI